MDSFGDLLGGNDVTEEWTVVPRNQDGTGAPRPDSLKEKEWQWVGEPPDKDNFIYEYGEVIEAELRYLCVEVVSKGLDFDEPAWVIEPSKEDDPAKKAARHVDNRIDELKEKVDSGPGLEASLTDVDDREQLQARLEGIVASRGIEIAETVDDVVDVLNAITSNPGPRKDPFTEMLTGADNQMAIDSPTDLAVLMAMPELKEAISDGRQAISNVKDMTGGDSAGRSAANALTGGNDQQPDQDKVQLDRDEYERLLEKAEGGGEPASEPEPEEEAEIDAGLDESDDFSLDEFEIDEEEDQDDEPEDVEDQDVDVDEPEENGAVDELDDEPTEVSV